jgi:hypothetical protein
MPNWKKVIVSGSDAALNSVTASSGITSYGDVYAPNFVGTASITSKVTVSQTTAPLNFPVVFTSTNSLFQDVPSSDFYYNPGLNLLSAGRVNATTALSASGLAYPNSDGDPGDVLTTDGSGKLTLDKTRVYVQVKNAWPTTLVKGMPVYVSGSVGNLDLVKPASASNANTMPAIGVLAESLAPNAEGLAIVVGFINGVNTSAFGAGDVVYVGANGGYTNVKPTGTNLIQNLGIVTKVAANGSGFVYGAGRSNDLPNITPGYTWVGNSNGVPTAVPTSSFAGSVTIIGDTNNRLVTANGDGTFTAEPTLILNGGQLTIDAATRVSLSGNRLFDITKNSSDVTVALGDLSNGFNATTLLVNDPEGKIELSFSASKGAGIVSHHFDNTGLFVSGAITASGLYIDNRGLPPAYFGGSVNIDSGLTAGSGEFAALTGDWLATNGANRVITSDGDGTFTAESGLTYNNSVLTVTGRASVSGRVNAASFTGSLQGTASAANRVQVNATSTDQYYTVPFVESVNTTSHARLGYENTNIGIQYNPSQNVLKAGHISASALTVTESFNITGRQYSTASYHLIEVPRGQMYTQGVFFLTGSFPPSQATPEWTKFPLLRFSTGSSLDLDMVVHIIPNESVPASSSVFRQNSTIGAIAKYPIRFESTIYTLPFDSGEYTFAAGDGWPFEDTESAFMFTQGFNTSNIADFVLGFTSIPSGFTNYRPQLSDEETLPIIDTNSPQGPILLSFVTGSNNIPSSYMSIRLLLSSDTNFGKYISYIQNAKLRVTCNYKLLNYA